jgi:hypothetical protein
MTAAAHPDVRSFVRAAKLPPRPRKAVIKPRRTGMAAAAQPTPLETGKNQAAVVGSDVVAFTSGVTAENRQAIANSALLAQLMATKIVPDRKQIYLWYNEYFKVLENIGWTTQEATWAKYTEEANNLEAHEAILKAATALLGGGPALALVTSTIDALKSMKEGTPWITIFSRESQHAETANFQMTLVDQKADGPFLVSFVAFGLEANSKVTQVLFFKIKKSDATLKQYGGKVTINPNILDSIRGDLETKLKDYVKSYIAALPPFN